MLCIFILHVYDAHTVMFRWDFYIFIYFYGFFFFFPKCSLVVICRTIFAADAVSVRIVATAPDYRLIRLYNSILTEYDGINRGIRLADSFYRGQSYIIEETVFIRSFSHSVLERAMISIAFWGKILCDAETTTIYFLF